MSGQERRRSSVVEDLHDVGRLEGPAGAALHPAPRRHPRPGEQVGVVLDHRGRHDVVGAQAQSVGQVVDGLRRVPHQDHDVVTTRRPPGKAVHAVPGLLVVGRGAP